MNRSILFEFLHKDSQLDLRYIKIGRGSYPVFPVPDSWEQSYLLVNNIRFTDFQALMLFSTDLVVRFDKYADCQANIPYKDIEFLEVREYMNEERMALHNDKIVVR